MDRSGPLRLRRGLVRRYSLAAEDVCQLLHIGARDDGLALLASLAQPVHQLGAEYVDLAVEDPAPVGDFLLLPGQILDQVLQLLIRESPEIRESVHAPSLVDASGAASIAPKRQAEVEGLAFSFHCLRASTTYSTVVASVIARPM